MRRRRLERLACRAVAVGDSGDDHRGIGDGDEKSSSDKLNSSLAGGLWEYRVPTVGGVRYEGVPGRVSDADRLDVDRAQRKWGVEIALEAPCMRRRDS